MGLLSPSLGRKNVLSVIAMGFIIGIVGGVFFITPIYDEIPNIAGGFEQLFNGDSEKITLEINNNTDINSLNNELKNIEGVKSVDLKGFSLITSNFTDFRKTFIESTLSRMDGITSYSVNTDGFINASTNDSNPNDLINNISTNIMYTGGIYTNNSYIYDVVTVESSKLNTVKDAIIEKDLVIISVDGPVTKTIADTKNNLLDHNLIIFIMGLIGILVALIGIFFDQIIELIKRIAKFIYINVYLKLKKKF